MPRVTAAPSMPMPASLTRTSKSQLKRDAQTLRIFGIQLVALKASMLEKMPLDDTLRSAIILAQSLKRSAQRRQLNYIAKLLRGIEVQPLKRYLRY